MKKNIILRTLVAGILASASLTSTAFPTSHYAQSSKLASGHWVKIKVSESGIYQITDAQAREWGFSGIATLHVFGKGGAPISEKLTADIPDDLPQLPVLRTTGKILFYAQGPDTWTCFNRQFQHVNHPYSTDAYYFVTDDSNYSDVAMDHDDTPMKGEPVTSFIERLWHEKEITNPGQTGRDMLGEDFTGTPQQTYTFDLKGKVPGSQVSVHTTTGVFQTSQSGNGKFTFQYNGTNLPEAPNDIFKYVNTEHLNFYPQSMLKTFTMEGEKLNYTIKYTLNGASMRLARLNAINVNYERALTLSDGPLYIGTHDVWIKGTPMKIANATADAQVWDVTVPYKPVVTNSTINGSTLTFVTTLNSIREYVAFEPARNYPSPAMVEKVANQDIHSQPTPDMVIITHQRYMPQAQRVAKLHEDQDSMRVLVLNQEEIFNEFSSGTPDAMAYRMLCKFFYDRGTDEKGHHLQYALLMGNGTYDNKQITSDFKANAYPALLTWQSEVSNSEVRSYNFDSFMATLQDNADNNWGSQQLKIGVGRFPVKSEEEAQIAVDKLYQYVTTPSFGMWRNNILVLADDEEKADFMIQCEDYISSGKKNHGEDFMYKRIYLDAYDGVSVGATRTYPGAREALYGGLKNGALVWCYNGHSSPNVMSGHDLVRRNDYINNMYYKHLPFMIGTTCELARYDAADISGGEYLFLNKNGGAIAVFSTTRQAYKDRNTVLGVNIFKHLLSRDSDGLPLRIGDIFKGSLNENPESNNMAFLLLGDPAMRLAMPLYKARIETINGKPVNHDDKPVFKARQTVTFTGTIVDHKGNKVPNFNGQITSNLYDCEQSITTHGYGSDGKEFTYQEHTNRIALGNDSVKNGVFSITLTIPSEIMYSYDNYTPSLINLYASDTQRGVDALGASEDFYIYGYDESAKDDNDGPNIIYMGLNSENFKDGDDVNESPLVVASLSDASGINLSDAGIGHSMTLTLDGKTEFTNVNSFYTPLQTTDGTFRGTISYPLKNLTNGTHTLQLRVWDAFSNMSEKTVTFNVVNGLKPELYEVYATNNPAYTSTTFYVKHNRPDATLNINIEVFDLMGRLVWFSKQSGQSDMFTSFPVTWNLTDMNGARVPRGIYVYRATVSTDGVREATKSKKIAVAGE